MFKNNLKIKIIGFLIINILILDNFSLNRLVSATLLPPEKLRTVSAGEDSIKDEIGKRLNERIEVR